VFGYCCMELCDDDGCGDALVGGEAENITGAVVNPGQNLDIIAVAEAVMSEI